MLLITCEATAELTGRNDVQVGEVFRRDFGDRVSGVFDSIEDELQRSLVDLGRFGDLPLGFRREPKLRESFG